MSYLVDSDIVIDWLQGRRNAVEVLSSFKRGQIAISVITYGEIYEGIYYGIDRIAIEAAFGRFLQGTTVLTLNKLTMEHFANIRGDLRKKGQLLGDMDLLIAATAIAYNLTLVTGNFKHFKRVRGLTIY
jgi:tRNA(fMet)-specific endonuclease VapC